MEDSTEKKMQPEGADSPAAETEETVTASTDTSAAPEETEAVSSEKSADAPKKKKFAVKNKTLAALLIAGAVLLLAIIVAGGLSIHYEATFLPGTIINGYNCGGSSAEGAAEYLLGVAAEHSAVLRDGEGDDLASVPLGYFVDADGFTAAVQVFFDEQHAASGFFGWMAPGEQVFSASVYALGDTTAAREYLTECFYSETPRTAPVNATIVLGEDGYTVDPGSAGHALHMANCLSALEEALPLLTDLREASPVIAVENGRIRQNISPESASLVKQCAALDEYLAAQVTIEFQDTTYTLTPEDIWHVSSVTVEPSGVVCTPDLDLVRTLSDSLADEYALEGVYAKFHNAEKTRPYVYYRVGDTGWILNRDALAEDIAAALSAGGDSTVTLSYDTSWYWKNQYWYYNVGDTFVEISLDNQYMWYYVDGKVLVETPVVTGNISAGDNTRVGCFRIASMTTDTYLVGPTWNDHVDYWMPFDDQIGLHDSSWRSEYGGDIYLTDGSHGCVNTPLDAIATIYNNISVGTIVIVY